MNSIPKLALIAGALALSTTSAFATGVPVNCLNGEKHTPQPPIITPAYTEDVPDIYHEAWIEVTPDIQHDGWVEIVPDIVHPAWTEVIEHPDLDVRSPPPKYTFVYHKDVCVYPNGWHNVSLMPDCLTMWDTKSLAPQGGSHHFVKVPDTYVEHPETTEVVPDIDHPAYVEDVPDIVHDAYTEVTPDIEHPEIVTPQPDLVEPEKTIIWLVGLDPKTWKPIYTETKAPGTCQIL